MRRISLFTLDTPYREPLTIWGYELGRPDAGPADFFLYLHRIP